MDLANDINEKHVLIVEDIIDSGKNYNDDIIYHFIIIAKYNILLISII